MQGGGACATVTRSLCLCCCHELAVRFHDVSICGGGGLAGQGGDCATVTGSLCFCSCHEKVAQYFQLISAADASLRGRAALALLLIFSVDICGGGGPAGQGGAQGGAAPAAARPGRLGGVSRGAARL